MSSSTMICLKEVLVCGDIAFICRGNEVTLFSKLALD